MRPTVFLLGAAALAASAVTAVPATAQDARADRERTYSRVETGPEGLRIFRTLQDDDRAVLGVSLGSARGARDSLGVRVTDVTENGPAAKAGIEEGDRIVAIDGTTLRVDPADAEDPVFRDLASRRLQRALAKHKAGDEVTLTVQRGRETRTVKVKTVAAADLPSSRVFAVGRDGELVRGFATARAFADSARARAERRPAIGLSLGATGNRRDTLGLFVSAVAADGPAEKAGIVEGARIAGIDGVDLRLSRDDVDDPELASIHSRRFTRALQKHAPGDDVRLRVWQNGAYRDVTVKAAKASDVYKGRGGFSYSFGDGDGMFVMPSTAPLPPLPPGVPLGPSVRMPMSTFRAAPLALPRVAPRMAPRARTIVAPRVPRTVDM